MYVKPKKHLGQHFLTDLSVARRIADSLYADRCNTVLEVGCGTGVLTRFLLERKDITLYGAEVDGESVAYLHEYYPDFAPRLIEGDFLQMDLAARFPQGVNVIGNFPYNISSQIFFKVLEYKELVPEVVGMVQREVAVRIAEPPGSKEYGILSVLLQAYYDIEYLFTVSEGVFNPRCSILIVMKRCLSRWLKRGSINGAKRYAIHYALFLGISEGQSMNILLCVLSVWVLRNLLP